jgi:hypothetical protein
VVTQKENGHFAVQQYGLLPLDENVSYDESILLRIAAFRKLVNEDYLSGFGYTMGETIAASTFSFTPIDLFGDEPGEDTLGNLIADSYIHAANAAGRNVDLAVVPAGVVRGSFSKGPITVDDVFKVSSLGIGADGVPGYPLVTVYLTGRELWDLCEVDASVSLLMEDARLYTAGLRYAFNPGRLFLNRVTEVYLEKKDGTLSVPKNDELYCVIGGLYSTQMLGSVKEKSFGLLSIVPKDKDGKPIEDFEAHILYKGAAEYKEWVALADYLAAFEKADGVPFVPQRYAAPVGIKTIQTGRSLADILKRPNKVFFILCGAVLAVLLVISLIVWLIVRLSRRRRRRRAERAEAA